MFYNTVFIKAIIPVIVWFQIMINIIQHDSLCNIVFAVTLCEPYLHILCQAHGLSGAKQGPHKRRRRQLPCVQNNV